MLKIYGIYLLAILLFGVTAVVADSFRHGDIRPQHSGLVWDEGLGEWVSIDRFWINHVKANGGLTWGSSSHYPEYKKVQEFYTFLVQLPSGSCLMEFFHNRWRRANDVRRWDPLFNQYGGCPAVFD